MFLLLTTVKLTVGIVQDQLVFRPEALQSFSVQCAKFMDIVGPLIHLTYGGPARRSELMLTKITNTQHGQRNIHHINGQLVFLGRYHKNQNQTGYEKVSPG
jgi:hypothetical protein